MAKKSSKTDIITSVIFFVLAAALIFFEILPISFSDDEAAIPLIKTAVSRFLGGFIFLILIIRMKYRVFGSVSKKYLKGALLCFPALVIVVNNLPIIGLVSGNAYVERTDLIPLFALQCLAIGFFEELAFRGFVFPYVMEKRHETRTGIFFSIVISGGIFGLVHMLNLFAGASPASVFLQIGYSFLIGAMCSVVLLRTNNIWICAALHAIYDFCGFLVPTLGGGKIWDTATVILTVILSLAVTAYMTCLFFTTDIEDAKNIYRQN